MLSPCEELNDTIKEMILHFSLFIPIGVKIIKSVVTNCLGSPEAHCRVYFLEPMYWELESKKEVEDA